MTAADAAEAPRIDLRERGTPESRWRPFVAALPAFRWPDCQRLVVVSPHPDDETFGAGGLLAAAALRGLPVLVISVTDGERATPAPDLAERRRGELTVALQYLAPGGDIPVQRVGLPDGAVGEHEAQLSTALARTIVGSDLVVCPLLDDGHPDHEASARAAISVANACGAAVRMVPIWAWHWHVPETTSIAGGAKLRLGPVVRARKRRAITRYRSQLDGPDPVVPGFMLDRLDRPVEVLVAPVGSR